MYESFDRSTIFRLLKELDRRDTKREVFGSCGHGYRLGAPLDRAVMESYEEQHAVTFPGDYKYFMCEVGNGGAGPSYGVLPFGLDDDGISWEAGLLVGDTSKPFPHEGPWNLPDSFWQDQPDPPPDILPEEEDRMMEAWDEVLEETYWNPAIVNGAIPVCHKGCALRQWLVINGGQKGFLWDDRRADFRGISPVLNEAGRQVTFSDWYMGWILRPLLGTGRFLEIGS